MKKIEEALYKFAYRIGEVVNDPEYYNGPWYVYCNGRRKKCSNHTTAKAWVKYLRRRGFTNLGTGKR